MLVSARDDDVVGEYVEGVLYTEGVNSWNHLKIGICLDCSPTVN